MTAAAIEPISAMQSRPQAQADSRLRTRVLFAAAFGSMIFLEAYIGFLNTAPADLRLHYLWRSLYWSAVDVGLWWLCISAADGVKTRLTYEAVPYVAAAMVASGVAPFLHWATGTWYFEPPIPSRPPFDPFLSWWQVGFVGAWRITLLTAGYYLRLRSIADDAHLASTRLDGVVLGRKAVESQLRALQGKVDPNLLFETLDDIEQACEWDAERADRMLERLIAFLRAALPHGDDEDATTVEEEISLAKAYLALAEARSVGLACAFECDERVLHATIAPMLLTPLVAHAVRAMRNEAGRVAVSCMLEQGHVSVVVAVQGAEAHAVWQSSADVAEVAKRLEGVYGPAASLAVGAVGTDNMQIVLRFPHEQPARRHR
jgi:hypothetical protein